MIIAGFPFQLRSTLRPEEAEGCIGLDIPAPSFSESVSEAQQHEATVTRYSGLPEPEIRQHDLADIVQRDGTMLEIRLYDHHFLIVEAATAGLGVALSPRQRTTSIEGGSSHLPVSIATKATMASSGQENLSCPGKHTILLDGCKHSAR